MNSVLLDTDPEDSHERLIVAAFVNQNVEGSKLILNNTTILPNVHGLPSIIALIFAPTVEYRYLLSFIVNQVNVKDIP